MEDNIKNNDLQNQANEIKKEDDILELTFANKTFENNIKPQKSNNLLVIIAIILGVIGIVLGVISIVKKSGGETIKVKAEKVVQSGNLKIAYINTDTIMAKYSMAVEMQKSLEAQQTSLSNTLRQKYLSLQQEEQNYMKTGDNLTLTQQQAKEKEFKQREQQLSQQMQEQPARFQKDVAAQNEKLLNTVLAFVKDYNSKHEKYNIIMSVSRINGPTLYIDEGMDITDEIVKGLNEEYKNYKANK